MTEPSAKQLLRGFPHLAAWANRFNGPAPRDAHPSWLRSGPRPCPPVESGAGRRTLRYVSRRLAALLPPNIPCHWDFEPPSWRLALLSAATLEKLVVWAGAATLAPVLADAIGRDRVRAVKSALGEDLYRFAIKRAPFLVGGMRFPFEPPASDADLAAVARRRGLACLAACFREAPDALIQRLRLRLPREWAERFPADEQAAPAGESFLLMKKVLLQEVGPTWLHLFS